MVKLNSEGYVSFSNADMGVAPRHDSHFVPKEKRIDFVVKKIKGLYTFNPEINRGVVLFGVSSCSEGYEYQVSPDKWTDSIVICDTVERLINALVAPLEKRLTGIAGVRSYGVKKLIYARVYWVSKNNQATLLLDNYDWFSRVKVAEAFAELCCLKYGKNVECQKKDVGLKLVKFNPKDNPILVWAWEYTEGKYLMCSTVSGAIIDTAETEVINMEDVNSSDRGRYTVLLTRLRIENDDLLKFL